MSGKIYSLALLLLTIVSQLLAQSQTVKGKVTDATTGLNAIPEAAIDRVEILRDGASAEYGSDEFTKARKPHTPATPRG